MESFNELYRRHKDELMGFLGRYMFGDHADDVSQVVWSNVHEYRTQFDSDYRFKDWLFMMAAKKAHQWMDKRRPEINIHELEGFDPIDESCSSGSEMVSDVKRLVALLPQDQREVIIARYIQGIRQTDLARIRNVQRMSLHRIEKRAIHRLRREMCEVVR